MGDPGTRKSLKEDVQSKHRLVTQAVYKSNTSSTPEPKSTKEAQLQLDSPMDNLHLLHAATRHAEAGGHLWERN